MTERMGRFLWPTSGVSCPDTNEADCTAFNGVLCHNDSSNCSLSSQNWSVRSNKVDVDGCSIVNDIFPHEAYASFPRLKVHIKAERSGAQIVGMSEMRDEMGAYVNDGDFLSKFSGSFVPKNVPDLMKPVWAVNAIYIYICNYIYNYVCIGLSDCL